MDIPLTLGDPNLLTDTPPSVAEKALRIPPEMILQIASGLDTPLDIALRYGFTETEFKTLEAWQPFQQEVAKARSDLEKTGVDFTLDSRLKAKELSNVIFLRAMNHDATFGQIHDAFRTFTEFGDLNPKNKNQANATSANPGTPAFSINIVLSNHPRPTSSHHPHFKDVSPTDITHPAPILADYTVEIPPIEVMGTENPFVVKSE